MEYIWIQRDLLLHRFSVKQKTITHIIIEERGRGLPPPRIRKLPLSTGEFESENDGDRRSRGRGARFIEIIFPLVLSIRRTKSSNLILAISSPRRYARGAAAVLEFIHLLHGLVDEGRSWRFSDSHQVPAHLGFAASITNKSQK